MAASPVIIDDGGSTRIKQLGAANKDLDRLLESPNADLADGRFPETFAVPGDAECSVTIVLIKDDATAQKVTTYQTGSLSGQPLKFGGTAVETAEVLSELNQSVKVYLGANGILQLDLNGGPGQEPVVEARQIAKQRRYIIMNAGLIRQVKVKGNPVFAGSGIPNDVIYTMVMLG